MRLDLSRIEAEITPLLTVHGVELLALEWLQGPGHGILRVFIDRPDGDPRAMDPERSVSLEQVTNVTRDVSTALDALDLIEDPYTLEIGSPGPERPVQKRADFERFAGLEARIDVRGPSREKATLRGVLRGCADGPDGVWVVRVEAGGKLHDVPSDRLIRTRLAEIAAAKTERVGKIPSRRQERLAAREKARAINAARRAALQSVALDGEPQSPTQSTQATDTNRRADAPRVAKR